MSIPKRGDILKITLNPTQGNEINGDNRPVLVLSTEDFNRQSGLLLVAPITQGEGLNARKTGFAVTLMGSGTETQGIVVCDQIRTIDARARKSQFVERVNKTVIDEVLDCVRSILED